MVSMELLLSILLSNTHDILRKDPTYNIQVKPHDWPLVSEHWIETMNSGEYIFVTLPSMNDLCRAINRRIWARKNGAFEFN